MPTKARREDAFIEGFLSAYEDESWADAEKDWVDQHTDGGVDMLATRKSDGKTLAIEHTVVEPFVGEIEDYNVFFEPSFQKLDADPTLVVPGRRIQVFVPVRALEGQRKLDTRIGIIEAVREWIRNNGATVVEGDSRCLCSVRGVRGLADYEIELNVKAKMLEPGVLHVRRQQTKSDFPDVIRNVMERKVKKLAKQSADKRVLMLERQHINLVPKFIMDEVLRQAPNYTEMADINEVWILETIGYQEPGWNFMFEGYDENGSHLGTTL